MREAKALARSCVQAGSLEPSPHADVIRRISSCADQFIVLIFHCRLFILFSYSVYNLKVKISKRHQSAFILTIQSPCYPN